MTIETYIWIGVLILIWFWTCNITKNKYQNKFEDEMKNFKEKYEREISQLKNRLKESSTNYESLTSEHEELLTRFKNKEEDYHKMLTQKYAAERLIADLQKDLYCARKHAKKLNAQFVSILSKLLGTNQN